MSEDFRIASVSSKASMVLTHARGRSYHAQLSGEGLSSSVIVDPLIRMDDLEEYFAGLARDWRGWDGERRWASKEGEFDLLAKHDRAGHIALEARIGYAWPFGWSATVHLALEAGSLDAIAANARAFCQACLAAA